MENLSTIKIERKWAMPSPWTFSIRPIHYLIKEELTDGLWVDPFAGKYSPATIRNDLNPDYSAEYHMDALDFLSGFSDASVDGVLFDPPYSPRQIRECYDHIEGGKSWDGKATFWSQAKNECARILRIGGKVSAGKRCALVGIVWDSEKNVVSICSAFYSLRMAATTMILFAP